MGTHVPKLAELVEQVFVLVGLAGRWWNRDHLRFRQLKSEVEEYRRDVDDTETGKCSPAVDWAPVHRWNDLLRKLQQLKVNFVLLAQNDQDFAFLIDCMERGDLRAARKRFPMNGSGPELDLSLGRPSLTARPLSGKPSA